MKDTRTPEHHLPNSRADIHAYLKGLRGGGEGVKLKTITPSLRTPSYLPLFKLAEIVPKCHVACCVFISRETERHGSGIGTNGRALL